jgi:hypothetical protein
MQNPQCIWFWSIFLVLLFSCFVGGSLGEKVQDDDDDIRIVGMPGGVQVLPAQYVSKISRWILTGTSAKTYALEAIPTDATNNDGFVNPTSTTQLWWPMDLPQLQVRPTLDIVLQNGHPKYACGGLDVRVPTSSSDDVTKEWRNHGLNSQPLARQWVTFGQTAVPGFHVEAFMGINVEEGQVEWKALSSTNKKNVYQPLELFGKFWAGLDESSPLSEGFHAVSIPVTHEWFQLPGDAVPLALMSLATAEKDVRGLISQPSTTTTSLLAVDVIQTAPGSESEHLPEAYKDLYYRNK